jgi:hypothetical protein
VQVAVLVTNVNKEVIPADTSELHQRLMAGTLTPADRQGLAQTMAEINNDLLERSRLLARTGSKIIVIGSMGGSIPLAYLD